MSRNYITNEQIRILLGSRRGFPALNDDDVRRVATVDKNLDPSLIACYVDHVQFTEYSTYSGELEKCRFDYGEADPRPDEHGVAITDDDLELLLTVATLGGRAALGAKIASMIEETAHATRR